MISNSLIKFLKALKKNNNKDWFHDNNEWYQTVKEEFIEMVSVVLLETSKFDPTLRYLEPRKCIFRINRDIRFSNDKSPYKTNFGAWFSRDGRLGNSAGYYLHISPGEYFISGGLYMPPSDVLKSVRTEIYNYSDDLKKILKAKEVKKQFGELWHEDMLVNGPKGFDKDFEDIELLKHKHFILNKNLTEKDVISKDYVKGVVSAYKAMHPFIEFLNRGIDENKAK